MEEPSLSKIDFPIRAATGRYCQFNCMQEALLPILKQYFHCDAGVFNVLRFIGLHEIDLPLRNCEVPGDFGGVPLSMLEELYQISWVYPLTEQGANNKSLIEAAAASGPFIARVDRFFLPSAPHYYQLRHDPHVILLVSFASQGLYYSDYEYPFQPAFLPWSIFWEALLPGYQGQQMLVAGVQNCQDLTTEAKINVQKKFLQNFLQSLQVSSSSIATTLHLIVEIVEEAVSSKVTFRGYEAAQFFNGVVQSLEAADGLFQLYGINAQEGQMNQSMLAPLRQPLLATQRFLLMYLQSTQQRYHSSLQRICDRFIDTWQLPVHTEIYERSELLLERVCAKSDSGSERGSSI